MPHKVTNIEGFEITNGGQYFSTDLLPFGGAWGTSLGPLARLGAGICAITFGQGWGGIPMEFLSSGRAVFGGLVFFVAAITRCYIAPQFFLPPAGPYTVMAHVISATMTYVARVELNAAGVLSVNGVSSGAPTILVFGTYYRLELMTNGPGGMIELRVEGATEVQIAGPTGNVDYIQLGDERVGANGSFTYDDLLVEATRINPAEIDWPGAGRVERYISAIDGTDNAWVNFGGANKSNSISDDPPDGDVTYIHNNTAVADQTVQTWTRTTAPFGSPSLSLGGGEGFRAIKAGTITRSTGAVVQWRYARIRSGATTDETAAFNTNAAAYQQRGQKCYQDDPDIAAPWTGVAADALEAGLGIDNAMMGRCTNLVVQMERGVPFPLLAGRAKINPHQLGGPLHQINPPSPGG